jgi:polysaccharide biosynthesis/export protein
MTVRPSVPAAHKPRSSWFSRRPAVAILLIALLGGCAQTAANLPPAPPVPIPVSTGPADLAPYRLQVGDLLYIRLYLNPEMNEDVVVRPDGMISTAIAEDVMAYNHTPAEIATELRERYKSVLSDPQIGVVVHSFAPNRVYVGGEVNSPGEFITVGPNLTVSQAIARAGGVKLGADRAKVFLLRRGAHDKPEALSVDYMGIVSGKNPTADVRLAQYDVVYVPRTGVYEAYAFWNQHVQQFIPFNWGFNYNVNPSNN